MAIVFSVMKNVSQHFSSAGDFKTTYCLEQGSPAGRLQSESGPQSLLT